MATLMRLTALVAVLALAACGGPGAGPRSSGSDGSEGAGAAEQREAAPATETPAGRDTGTAASTPADPDAPGATDTPAIPDAGAAIDTPAPAAGSPDPRRVEPAEPQAARMRAAWVHLFDTTLKSRAAIAALVERLAAAGATAVIAQVARRHDAYYASDVLPPTRDPDLEAGLDVVEELTARAHEAGLEMHAWVAVAPTWHGAYDELDAPAGWVGAERGRDAPDGQRWVTRDDGGEWSDYLDFGLPQVREHTAAVAAELAERYPIDGVHLDYVRYPSERHGYHPAALARYGEETGAAGTPEPDDPAWKAWRREQTRDTVAHVRQALAATDPDVMLSAAVVTWGGVGEGGFEATRTANEALQDWPGWVRDGLVDAVMPMNYFRAVDGDQARWFDQWTRFERELAASSDVLVVPGIAGYLNSADAALAQIHAAARVTDGAVMYSYQEPTEDGSSDIWGALARSRWGEQAP